ncbi:AAA family ATPase [Catenulispora rubra]|uniref:AAA family ATPase n=1 Tax=Catenulispora rubra TaxID=280293 RepID=UPI00189241AD|nr:AAA family ATPase [Catenulispora rubra]
MARLIVVTGIPASGKTTVAAALAQRSTRAVVVDGDTIRAMVVSGYVDMARDPSEEALRQLRLRYQASLAVAHVYLQAGFDVVFNDNVLGPLLDELPGLVPCDQFHLVVLNPGPEVIRDRDREREKTAYTAENGSFDWLREVLANETPRLGLWLDTSHQTPDESADVIIAKLDESLISTNIIRSGRWPRSGS